MRLHRSILYAALFIICIPFIAFAEQLTDKFDQSMDSARGRERFLALSAGLTSISEYGGSNNGVSFGWTMAGQFGGALFGGVSIESAMQIGGKGSSVALALVPELVLVLGGQQSDVRGLLTLGGGAGFNSESTSEQFLSPVVKAGFGLGITLNSKSNTGMLIESGALGYLGGNSSAMPFVRVGFLFW